MKTTIKWPSNGSVCIEADTFKNAGMGGIANEIVLHISGNVLVVTKSRITANELHEAADEAVPAHRRRTLHVAGKDEGVLQNLRNTDQQVAESISSETGRFFAVGAVNVNRCVTALSTPCAVYAPTWGVLPAGALSSDLSHRRGRIWGFWKF